MFYRFLKDKVNFSLSTDDPGFNQKSIINDYLFSIENFKFSVNDIKNLVSKCSVITSEK